jgi:hypothetical protein
MSFEISGVYPNPFVNYTGLQFYLHQPADVTCSVYALSGALVFQKYIGFKSRGLYFEKFDLSSLAAGEYLISRKLIKQP